MYEFFLKLDLKCNTYSANLALLKSVCYLSYTEPQTCNGANVSSNYHGNW